MQLYTLYEQLNGQREFKMVGPAETIRIYLRSTLLGSSGFWAKVLTHGQAVLTIAPPLTNRAPDVGLVGTWAIIKGARLPMDVTVERMSPRQMAEEVAASNSRALAASRRL